MNLCAFMKNVGWTIAPIISNLFFTRDILMTLYFLCNSECHAQMFLDYLNEKHDNIKYIMECEDGDSLAFLDTTVHRKDNRLVTSVYRKPTFTA